MKSDLVPSGRRRVATSLTVLVVLAALGGPVMAARRSRSCDNVERSGAWSSIRTPASVNAFGLLPGAPGGIVVTDGRTVYATRDGGCSWGLLLTVPAVPSAEFPFAAEKIVSIVAVSSTTIYLALTGPHVVVSRDGGESWSTSDSGLVARGDPVELAAAPGSPHVLYLPVRTRAGDDALDNGLTGGSTGASATVTEVFRSDDSGRSWTSAGTPGASLEGPRGSRLAQGTLPGAVSDVAVSSADPRRLWAATAEGLLTSGDAGSTWSPAVARGGALGGADVRAVDVVERNGVGVIAVDPSTGVVYTSDRSDGTGSWTARKFVGLQTAYSVYDTVKGVWLAHSSAGDVLATGPKGVFRLTGRSWSDVSPVSLDSWASAMVDVAAVPGSDVFYGRPKNVGTSLFRYDPTGASVGRASSGEGGIDSDDPLAQLSQKIAPLAPPAPAHLAPARASLHLRPGARTTKHYRLDLPPRPSPMDVYFLLDSTQSMSGVIRSLARSVASIASEVRRQGIDLWAGVGEFRTYPYPGQEQYDFPYRRDLPVGPVGPKLAHALLGIEGVGESGANLTALVQAATGAGQDVFPLGPSPGDVPAGADAGFRPGAIPVILHAADDRFGTPSRGDPDGKWPPPSWPGPSFDTAIAALNASSVRQVGAAVGFGVGATSSGGSPNALADLRRVARGTGTVAPTAIDCDGDGRSDLARGAPLVCPVPAGDGAALVPAVVSLLEGIHDTAPVRLVATDGADVASVSPGLYPDVDMKRHNDLSFDVVYRCPPTPVRSHTRVQLNAIVRDATVASARADLVCAPRRSVRRVTPRPALRSPAPIAALVPPPPPPPPPGTGSANAPVPQAQPQPQSNPNPNTQAQPQPVPVPQRQQQPQLVFVHAAQEVREQLGMEYAMSRVNESRADPIAAVRMGLAAGAISLVLLYGYASVAVGALRRRTSSD